MKVSSKEEWLALVEKLQTSGLTKSEFCRRNRISSGRFYDLAKRYGDGSIPSTHGARRTRKPRTEAPEFLKVDVALPSAGTSSSPRILRIVTSYGTTLEIPL
jgi:hypothetical protein